MAFFDGMRLVSEWRFLRPSEAVSGLEQLIDLPLYPLDIVALAVFPVIAVYWLAVAVRDASVENLTRATVALIAADHVRRGQPSVAVVPGLGRRLRRASPHWWVSRFIAGVALLIPFTLATWWIPSIEPYRDVATLAMYAAAALWVALTREPAAAKR